MKEIIAAFIGGLVGAAISFLFSIWLRNSTRWKLFQEEVGEIHSKFLVFDKKAGIEQVSSVWDSCAKDLCSAVFRVLPYVFWSRKRGRLCRLLEDYCNANTCQESGFLPVDMAGLYKNRAGDCFEDPKKAVKYLIGILSDMTRL